MLALVNSIRAAPECVRDCRVDVFVDSQVLIDSWYGQGSRKSLELTNTTKDLFFVLAARNLQLNLFHVSSRENSADGPSLCFPAICSSGSSPEVPLSFWNSFHCGCSSIFPALFALFWGSLPISFVIPFIDL